MSRPPRLSGFDYTGMYRYLLTICTHDRAPHFATAQAVDLVHAQFRYSAHEQEFEIPAYCYMEEHLHMLVVGVSERAEFVRFVTLSKQRSGYRYKREFGKPLWQEGFHDRVLREDEDTPGVIAYIVMNPVRAGLVVAPQDYPFWGSETHSREALLDYLAATVRGG